MLAELDRVYTKDATLEMLQDRLAEYTLPLTKNELLDGTLIESITLVAATPLVINHKLNRNPRGWLVVDNVAACTVHRTAWTTTTITLEASANTTVSIWVF
jgi:hypothetical protein